MSLAATLAGAAAARSQAYWLLSRLLLEPPDEPFIRELGEFFSAAAGGPAPELAAAARDLAASARGLAERPLDAEIAVDFTRLVAGLFPHEGLPPVESAVREGRVLGESAAAVAVSYAEAGFPEPLAEAGPPDHAATGLRFMALCCHAEAQAWNARDVRSGSQWLVRERAFLADHLAAWLPGFCEAAARRAVTPLYSAGFRLLSAMIAADLDDVREMIAQADREAALPPPT